jgi:hypothetical protein
VKERGEVERERRRKRAMALKRKKNKSSPPFQLSLTIDDESHLLSAETARRAVLSAVSRL